MVEKHQAPASSFSIQSTQQAQLLCGLQPSELVFPKKKKKKTRGSWWTTTRRQASNVPLLQRPTASPGLYCAKRCQHIMGGDPSALPRARETHGQLHIQRCALQYNRDRGIWFCSKETALKSVAYSLVIGLSGGQHENIKLKVGNLFFLG